MGAEFDPENTIHVPRGSEESQKEQETPAGGIAAVEVCLRILQGLMEAAGPLTLKEIASTTSTTPSKAHRYLQSLIAGGFAVQTRKSGKYDLGNMAMRLGYAALERIDLVNRATDMLEDLASETGYHIHLTVWTERGPIVVRWQKTATPLAYAYGIGSRKPVWTTATGHVFLAFLPRFITVNVLQDEFARMEQPPGRDEIESAIAKTRRAGYATAHGTFMERVTGIAAPVIDVQNEACVVVTLLKPVSHSDDEDAAAIASLLRFCRQASVLGETPATSAPQRVRA